MASVQRIIDFTYVRAQSFIKFLLAMIHCFHCIGRIQALLSFTFDRAHSLIRYLLVHPSCIQLIYFLLLPMLGYPVLKASITRASHVWPTDVVNSAFTLVSAATLTGLSVVEAEVFSTSQLVISTVLMFLGADIFMTMIGLLFAWFNPSLLGSSPDTRTSNDQVEMGVLSAPDSESQNREDQIQNGNVDTLQLKRNSIKCLAFAMLVYQLIVIIFMGFIPVLLYLSIEPTAKQILGNKDLKIIPFSGLIVVSSFYNFGFVPMNENMMLFRKNPGLLLLLIPQLLLGNTLYPPCLRLLIWALGKCIKKEEFSYILSNHRNMGMLSRTRCCFLAFTVVVLLVVQLLLFCCLEWNSGNMEGLNFYQKFIASLFQAVNSRHTGETVLDLSTVSSAVLVSFVVIMYLPPYTTWKPIGKEEDYEESSTKKTSGLMRFMLSQISFLAIFITAICITERSKLQRDPLNFNLLSTTVEVIGAYANVGWSMGYSCTRQVEADGHCKQSSTSLAGHYSSLGKLVLILAMLFGKLKTLSRNGGKGWTLY